MLRRYYTCFVFSPNRRAAFLMAGAWLLPGCSLSVPMFGDDDGPLTTGSVKTFVEVQQPLPQTLAYSDATKIGQAAISALGQVDKGAAGDWTNAATGSSGTVEPGAQAAGSAADCSLFNTIVTSIGGVHRYAGKICKSQNGRSVVEIEAPDDLPTA